MKTYLSSQLIPILAIAVMIFVGCSKNDDDGGGTPADDNLPKEYLNVTQGDETYSEGMTMISVEGFMGSTTVSVSSQYTGQYASAFIQFKGIPDQGSYHSSATKRFSFSKGDDTWVCEQGCTITVAISNKQKKYLKGWVSGTMTNAEGETVNDIACQFGVSYAD